MRLDGLFLLLVLLVVSGCATTLVKKDFRLQKDGWSLVVHELDDGPNSFTTLDAVQVSPGAGARLVWVILSVRNDAPAARTFDFERCNLRMATGGVLPSYVGMNLGTSAQTSVKPELSAGEEITRKLAFVYPEGQVPSRLVCLDQQIVMQ